MKSISYHIKEYLFSGHFCKGSVVEETWLRFLHHLKISVWRITLFEMKGNYQTRVQHIWLVFCFDFIKLWVNNVCWHEMKFMSNQWHRLQINDINAQSMTSVKSNSGLFCFCFTTLCDWLKNSHHFLDQSEVKQRSKTKTTHDLLARVFPRLTSVTWICLEFWLVDCVVCDCCDWLQ